MRIFDNTEWSWTTFLSLGRIVKQEKNGIMAMDYLRIYKLKEEDFDGIVQRSGGERLNNNKNPEKNLNADYLLGDAIIELKFVEEEGLGKQERQRKIAALFSKCFPQKPVVVLDPKLLSRAEKEEYYKIMYTPIKTHIRKAADQIEETSKKYKGKTKVAILLNVGYSSLSHKEFKSVVIRRAHNDTSQIDCLIIGGIYFYGDKFDYYILGYFEKIPINIDKSFNRFDILNQHWGDFLKDFMTSVVLMEKNFLPERLPVVDIDFEIDGVKYVKPSPPMGPSKFWVNGRPRENSTGITQCPPIAISFPKMDKENWLKFKEMMPIENNLQDTYSDWLRFTNSESEANNKALQPFIPVEVVYEDFNRNKESDKTNPTFRELCLYANEVFDRKAKELIKSAMNKAKSNIILPAYIFLLVEEIGQDKANDLCSIYYVRESLGQEKETIVLENEKLFFEYSLALAASYAIKYNVPFIVYERNQTYMWQ